MLHTRAHAIVRKLLLLLMSFVAATVILGFAAMHWNFIMRTGLVLPQPTNITFVQNSSISCPKRSETKLLLLLIVSTAPHRRARRDVIRETWWKSCKSYPQVKCLFFTDGDIENREVRLNLVSEQAQFQDIWLQPFAGGGSFGKRFLHHLTWSNETFEYEYFMRLDDDIMVCFDRLVHDLGRAPKSRLIWSYFHCGRDRVIPDESFVILSQDVVRMFLNQSKATMLCHANADQQIALWVQDLHLADGYHCEERIQHHPPTSHILHKLNRTNICQNYIALHGVYERDMFKLWADRGPTASYPDWRIPPLREVCSEVPVFKWYVMDNPYRHEPKLCASNPTWDMTPLMGGSRDFFKGRQGW